MIKDKIAKIIYDELYYMYCDNCRCTEIDEDEPGYGCDECHRKYNGWGISMAEANRLAEMAIEALSAEAVEVVRCKNCYHAEDDITHMFCVYFHHKVYEDDYCSNAVERRKDGEK